MASNEANTNSQGQGGDDDEVSKEITLHVKTPKEKKTFNVDENSTVKDFKQRISPEFGNAPLEQLCLIFAGKIMKDHETLTAHNVKDGMTVHLVIKTGNASTANNQAASATEQRPPSRPDVTQTPFGLGNLGGLSGLSGLGMGSANFMEMQQQIQSSMMNNPEMMRQIMDSPLTQSLMSNPEILRGLIQSNPQMRTLMDRNPELSHMLNNPEILRQTMEIARNPAMMQELMRNQDRAMSNLESIPGGQSALQRMYRDIQEPMLNAAQEQFGSNPFQALGGSSQNPATTQGGPVPNPWAPPSQAPAAGGGSSTDAPAGSQTGGALFSSPGMQSLLQQMTQNPQLMQNMLNAPYTQAVMQQLATNPDMAQNIIASNPLFAGNPALQEQMRASMPALLQQMQNPSVQGLMTNPEALGAIHQIQEGLSRLQRAAPDLYQTMGMPNVGVGMNLFAGGAGAPTSTSPSGTTSTTSSSSTTTSSTVDGTNSFQNLMASMVNRMAEQGLNSPPEERFRAQLETLESMGFVDRQANIQALIATQGNVNAAIDRLLQQNPSS